MLSIVQQRALSKINVIRTDGIPAKGMHRTLAPIGRTPNDAPEVIGDRAFVQVQLARRGALGLALRGQCLDRHA